MSYIDIPASEARAGDEVKVGETWWPSDSAGVVFLPSWVVFLPWARVNGPIALNIRDMADLGCPVRRKREPTRWEGYGLLEPDGPWCFHDTLESLDAAIRTHSLNGPRVRIVATEILDAEQGEQ